MYKFEINIFSVFWDTASVSSVTWKAIIEHIGKADEVKYINIDVYIIYFMSM